MEKSGDPPPSSITSTSSPSDLRSLKKPTKPFSLRRSQDSPRRVRKGGGKFASFSLPYHSIFYTKREELPLSIRGENGREESENSSQSKQREEGREEKRDREMTLTKESPSRAMPSRKAEPFLPSQITPKQKSSPTLALSSLFNMKGGKELSGKEESVQKNSEIKTVGENRQIPLSEGVSGGELSFEETGELSSPDFEALVEYIEQIVEEWLIMRGEEETTVYMKFEEVTVVLNLTRLQDLGEKPQISIHLDFYEVSEETSWLQEAFASLKDRLEKNERFTFLFDEEKSPRFSLDPPPRYRPEREKGEREER